MTRKLILLEPSKVGNQHITLINPYLEAALAAEAEAVEFWCAPSLWRNVAEEVRPHIRHRSIPVIDPSSRQFLAKIPLEVAVAVWAIIRMRRDDLLLVTCLFSPALYVFSWICRLFPGREIHVVLHGELEALLDRSISPRITGYGFWIRLFWKHGLAARRPGLVVIDKFVQDELVELSGGRLDPRRVTVLTMPIRPSHAAVADPAAMIDNDRPHVCFVGFRSRMKGFDVFEKLASEKPGFAWLAIGGGLVEDLSTGKTRPLKDLAAFKAALADCDVALFPYKGGYDLSMSAAVLDALSVGVFVIASPRGCFRALSEEFGNERVVCVDGEDGFKDALDKCLSHPPGRGSADFATALEASRFGQANLNREMRAFVGSAGRVAAR